MQMPKITVNLSKLEHNVMYLTSHVRAHDIDVAAVTKVFSAHPEIVKVYEAIPEIKYLADSRLDNFKNYASDSGKERLLLRIPHLSEVDQVVEWTDISLNSEIQTIRDLNQAAQKKNTLHRVILMIDLGDLREGVFEAEEVDAYVKEILTMNHVELAGIGVNLTCYGAIIPDSTILRKLVSYKHHIESTYELTLDIISGGNSSSLYLLDSTEDFMPEEINHLRIGEAYVLGVETAFGLPIPEMHQDVFTLSAEIIEYRDKPSLPIGNVGQDAFGQKPVFVDKGIMKRGILALGRQDVNVQNIQPRDERIEIIGASSDHLIMDFTKAAKDYQLGDEVTFDVSYGSLLDCFTSKYVHKEFITESHIIENSDNQVSASEH
ncbi:ornithine racemase Orr [Jeotgalibaca caeni]|uniref:ornithine racemase Orr n=1 Tax=Jeotgalibaca caeni TaxID=3028623 RepID=UPI00237E390C|nr:ornithine racemase Orr [Jeotgalibaca caeni]MDE1547608.1 ornithine racemase Orr [Jeotgalibaca caeni]